MFAHDDLAVARIPEYAIPSSTNTYYFQLTPYCYDHLLQDVDVKRWFENLQNQIINDY
jgi:hypothetical protein